MLDSNYILQHTLVKKTMFVIRVELVLFVRIPYDIIFNEYMNIPENMLVFIVIIKQFNKKVWTFMSMLYIPRRLNILAMSATFHATPKET